MYELTFLWKSMSAKGCCRSLCYADVLVTQGAALVTGRSAVHSAITAPVPCGRTRQF